MGIYLPILCNLAQVNHLTLIDNKGCDAGSIFLAVAENLVEDGAELTLLAREVELGVVGKSLRQVQLDEPGQNVKRGWKDKSPG